MKKACRFGQHEVLKELWSRRIGNSLGAIRWCRGRGRHEEYGLDVLPSMGTLPAGLHGRSRREVHMMNECSTIFLVHRRFVPYRIPACPHSLDYSSSPGLRPKGARLRASSLPFPSNIGYLTPATKYPSAPIYHDIVHHRHGPGTRQAHGQIRAVAVRPARQRETITRLRRRISCSALYSNTAKTEVCPDYYVPRVVCQNDALNPSASAFSTIDEVPSDTDTMPGDGYPQPIVNPGPLQGPDEAQRCRIWLHRGADCQRTDPLAAPVATDMSADGPGRRDASPADSAFGADPPRSPREGLEWVWHPRGYWVERDIDDPVPVCFGICG